MTRDRTSAIRDRPSATRGRRLLVALLPEARRSFTAVALATVLVLPLGLLSGGRGESDLLMVAPAVYLLAYVLITQVVMTRAPQQEVWSWASTTERGTWVDQFVRGTQPGVGIALTVSGLALAVVLWLPTRLGGGLLPEWAQVVMAVVLIASSWLTVLTTYAVAYLCEDARTRAPAGRGALDFPGTTSPAWADYLYFATAVSTTFGSTDVTVVRTPMRSLVRQHSLVAFVFNTVILAAVVSLLVTR